MAGDRIINVGAYSYLSLNAGFHSRMHKHADDLCCAWYDHKTNILIDSGRYGYIGKTKPGSELWRDGHWYTNPWRVYCELTCAHNTLEALFNFSEQLQINPNRSMVNASGREGLFCWEDASETHELRFERPTVGNMLVDYNVHPR